MVNRLTCLIDKNHLLNDSQAGFRGGRSTVDQLLQLHNEAHQSLQSEKHTVAIFLDFSEAFDLLWHQGLLYKLRKKNITGNVYKWIEDFLTGRTIQTRVGSELSEIHPITMGAPHREASFRRCYFLLMMSDFPESMNTVTSLYADDSAVWKSGGKLSYRG